jgi:hypothetical protein
MFTTTSSSISANSKVGIDRMNSGDKEVRLNSKYVEFYHHVV